MNKMIENSEQKIHIVRENKSFMSVINNIVDKSDEEKSFIVCDLEEVIKKYKEWMSILPRIKPFYAVKANDDLRILKTLTALGAGFDCSSKLEIEKVLGLGVSADRIIFANTVKLIPYIRYAASVGVKRMTFDNEYELHKIRKFHPDAELVLRFQCDDTTALTVLGQKFGCDPKSDTPRLLKIAQELGLNIIGTCFHIGSGCKNPEIFRTAISFARHIFDIALDYGYKFSFLDIGGGFPGETKTSLQPFADVINPALEEYFPGCTLEIISEPGSFFVTSMGKIVTNIHSMRTEEKMDDSGNIFRHNMYYINNGYYGCFNMFVLHSCEFDVNPLNKNRNGPLIKSSIWGPTCDSKDKICNKMMPQLHIGDWIVFNDLGHYTFTLATNFNGFPKPYIHFFARESIWKQLTDLKAFNENDVFIDNTLCKKNK